MNPTRGLVVEIDGGGVYALEADPDAVKLVGHRVTLEGVRSGFDRLDVEWIGLASSADITRPSA